MLSTEMPPLRQRLLRGGTLLLRHKLLLIGFATKLAALIVAGGAMMVYDLRTYQQALTSDMTVQADILGRASAPALAFNDPSTAKETLSLLKANPRIAAAAIYTAKGGLFATYSQGAVVAPQFPDLPEADGSSIDGRELIVFKRIVENKEILGTVYISARSEVFARIKNNAVILSLVMLLSLLVAVALSSWLHGGVIRPIVAISDIMRRVMESRDFNLRATKTTQDEVGSLVDGFNDMLAEIGRRSKSLEESNRTLEHEISERRGTEEALLVSERRHRTLVAAITSVVWAADGKGRFTEEQPSWAAYTGQTYHDYQGVGWRTAVESDEQNAFDLAWARSLSNPSAFELELCLWHASSGRYRYVSVRAVPVIEPNGEVREWIGTVSDIDSQRRAEKELHTLNAELEGRVAKRTSELEAANKELESFSYSVSHDLRAPVRAVAGYSKMLWEEHAEQFDAEAQRKLDIIQSEAQRMGVLIDDLLAFARLGRQALKKVELDMKQMAQNMFDRLYAQHQGARVEFRLGSLPRSVGDRGLLDQVWVNFISNALKFSAKREKPVIEVGAISDEKEHIYFVRDNGAGFDPRYQAKLFGVFQRLHDNSEFAGTGVGLALVHRIVTRHGGRVWADGKPDEGATFYFTLPKEQGNGGN